MRLAGQWRTIETGLGDVWSEARLLLTVEDEARADRAAALLGPATPGRHGRELRLTVSSTPGGTSAGAGTLRRMLDRLDREGITGTLELVDAREAVAAARGAAPPRHRPLAEQWAEELARLPDDWSDLHCEIELTSSDYVERGALLLGPVNPLRDGDRLALRFRVARTFGYGASQAMARRCLERCDAEGISGRFRVLRALADTDPVHTQGPVWYVGGRVV